MSDSNTNFEINVSLDVEEGSLATQQTETAQYWANQAASSASAASGSASSASGNATAANNAKIAAVSAKDAAELAQGKAEDAQEDAEAAVTHYPKIESGTWRVWDVENQTYTNTNVKATGNGIQDIYLTGSSGLVDTYTVLYTDGTTDEITIHNGTASIDSTLSISGRAADAKATGDAVDDLKTQIESIDGILYPNGDVVIASTPTTAQATANVYYPTTLLKKDNAYKFVLTISDATHLSHIRTSKSESGTGNVDVIESNFIGESWANGKTLIYTPNVEGIMYLQVQFNSAYVDSEASITLAVHDYTKERTTAIQELEADDNNIKNDVSTITPDIYLEDEYNLLPPVGYTVGKIIYPTGAIINYGTEVLSDYIPIDPSQGYICNYTKTASVVYGDSDFTGNLNTFDRTCFCFFDENKNVVSFTGNTSAVSKAIPENARYIRVTLVSEELYHLARLIYGNYNSQPIVRVCDYHKRNKDIYAEANTGFEQFKMVMFGDSITHGSLSVSDDGTSYIDFANDYLHSDIINVGFGGTRMTYALEDAGLFCFYNLCDCIVSEDADAWDDLDAYALVNTSYAPHLATLKAIDWTTVNAIGLMYGANDYASNTPVGSSYNETLTNYDGACAYGLKKLLAKYPHLQVMILSPFDREMTAGDASTMTDVDQNSAGLLMSDYGDSLENVVSRFHCPLIRTDKLFGINQYTILTYAPDGTHPRANIAQKRLGWLFAKAVENSLAPVS